MWASRAFSSVLKSLTPVKENRGRAISMEDTDEVREHLNLVDDDDDDDGAGGSADASPHMGTNAVSDAGNNSEENYSEERIDRPVRILSDLSVMKSLTNKVILSQVIKDNETGCEGPYILPNGGIREHRRVKDECVYPNADTESAAGDGACKETVAGKETMQNNRGLNEMEDSPPSTRGPNASERSIQPASAGSREVIAGAKLAADRSQSENGSPSVRRAPNGTAIPGQQLSDGGPSSESIRTPARTSRRKRKRVHKSPGKIVEDGDLDPEEPRLEAVDPGCSRQKVVQFGDLVKSAQCRLPTDGLPARIPNRLIAPSKSPLSVAGTATPDDKRGTVSGESTHPNQTHTTITDSPMLQNSASSPVHLTTLRPTAVLKKEHEERNISANSSDEMHGSACNEVAAAAQNMPVLPSIDADERQDDNGGTESVELALDSDDLQSRIFTHSQAPDVCDSHRSRTGAMRFYIGLTKLNRADLARRIIVNGGRVVSQPGGNSDVVPTFPLVDAQSRVKSGGRFAYSDTYIDDCISAGKALDLEYFRLGRRLSVRDRQLSQSHLGSTEDAVNIDDLHSKFKYSSPPKSMLISVQRRKKRTADADRYSQITTDNAKDEVARKFFETNLCCENHPMLISKGDTKAAESVERGSAFVSPTLRTAVDQLSRHSGVSKRRAFRAIRDSLGSYWKAFALLESDK
jgi:BRCT domain, a BRCA1 C-terminus domain